MAKAQTYIKDIRAQVRADFNGKVPAHLNLTIRNYAAALEVRDKYREEIAAMQEKIRTITALSGSIQAEEARNKKLAEQYFAGARKDIAQGQKSARAALDYYHNMARSTFTPPQYLDSRH